MHDVSLGWQASAPARPWRRTWLTAGCLCLMLGTIGIVLPLLPTVDFYVMAAWCFGRGSRRWERWLLNHPRIGPLVRDWRADRSVPLKAKWLATLSMSASCVWAAHAMPAHLAWIPALACLGVGCYLWTRPTRRPATVPLALSAGVTSNEDSRARTA